MTDVVDGKIGAEAEYNVDLVEGKIVIEVDYKGKQLETGLFLRLSLVQLLREAAKKTDNKLDDKLVDMIEAVM